MEDHAAAIVAQLIRIADALECLTEAQGYAVEPRPSIEQAITAVQQIDFAREARSIVSENRKLGKESKSK